MLARAVLVNTVRLTLFVIAANVRQCQPNMDPSPFVFLFCLSLLHASSAYITYIEAKYPLQVSELRRALTILHNAIRFVVYPREVGQHP